MSNWKILGKIKKKNLPEREEEMIGVLLKNRKITSSEEKNFFNPPNPLEIKLKKIGLAEKEINKAVKRIKSAIKNTESIVIYGDYDADGICATAILWEVLNKFTKKVMPYLPHRLEEGYGLSIKGIDAIIKEYQAKLIITVDCGITAQEAVLYAKKKQIDVIVTDHHLPPPKKPKALSIIHTTKISGAAVAWFLGRELLKKLGKKYLRELEEKLSLVAIGTISDVLPLLGINRSLVFWGLDFLRKTQRPGLKALFQDAGIKALEIDSYHIAFVIGPRINATGRLTHALDSLRLLCTKSFQRGRELAGKLGFTNRQRQKITEETFFHAQDYLEKTKDSKKEKLIFISHQSYNQGVIGLVAGKLAEKYYRPAVVISQGETYSKASARSIAGLNIISAIRETSQLLVDCGGHPMAAGFTVETVKIRELKKKLTEIIEEKLTDDLLIKSINVDCEVTLSDLTLALYQKLEKFKPYGLGNPEPLFATKDLTLLEARLVGKGGKHLKLRLTDDQGKEINAIAFSKGEFYSKLSKEKNINIIYTLTINDWNGKNIEMKVKEIKFFRHLP